VEEHISSKDRLTYASCRLIQTLRIKMGREKRNNAGLGLFRQAPELSIPGRGGTEGGSSHHNNEKRKEKKKMVVTSCKG